MKNYSTYFPCQEQRSDRFRQAAQGEIDQPPYPAYAEAVVSRLTTEWSRRARCVCDHVAVERGSFGNVSPMIKRISLLR